MIFKVKDREYTIKYGYEATANSGIMSKVARFEADNEGKEDNLVNLMGSMEDSMRVVAEMLLIGLQRYHKDEFEVDYNGDISTSTAISKVYDLLDEYFDEEDADFFGLYTQLQEELVTNGFLSKMFREEQQKAKTTTKKKVVKEAEKV